MSTVMPDAHPLPSLQDRLKLIRERIRKAAEKSGRPERAVTLVAVTKTVPVSEILKLAPAGVPNIAESKVQEAVAKRPDLAGQNFIHHFIGQLQTNKARKALELFEVIQSVDRPKLAEALDRIAAEMGKTQACLVEVKMSSEPAKSGVPLAEAPEFVRSFRRYKHLQLQGLMTIAPYDAPEAGTRDCFRSLAGLAAEMKESFGAPPVLSFGMSDDFEIAVEEGSNMVRIGRALFGER